MERSFTKMIYFEEKNTQTVKGKVVAYYSLSLLGVTVVANWDEMAVKLKCRKNHWEYENKQYTIEKSIENTNRNAKKNSF